MNSFKSYVKSGKVKKKTPDPEEAKALLQQAEERLEYLQNIKISEKTAKFVFEAAYEATREAAQSLMALQGLKPYSHEATVCFAKEYYSFNDEEIALFDHFRKLRADSIYRAVKILVQDAQESVEFSRKFVEKVKCFHSQIPGKGDTSCPPTNQPADSPETREKS